MGATSDKKPIVVLLHGLWVPSGCLLLLARRLRGCDFEVRLFDYSSVACDLRENAARLQRYLRTLDAEVIHFVGHSLGGIIIRALFYYHPEQKPGRIVTLATPHLGSHVVRRLWCHAFGRRILGKSVAALMAEEPQGWPTPARDIGVIRGKLGIGLGWLVPGLGRPNDGVVSVAEAQWPGVREHITLPVSHSGMLLSRQAVHQTCRFLRTGRFAR